MRRNIRKIWLLRGMAAVLLAITFGYLPYHLYAISGFEQAMELNAQLGALRAKNARLAAENIRFEREREALRSDSDLRAVERVARTELGWVRPGEVVFELGGDP